MNINLYKFGDVETSNSTNKGQWIDICSGGTGFKFIQDITICSNSSHTITFSLAFANKRKYKNQPITELTNIPSTIMFYNKVRIYPCNKPYIIQDPIIQQVLTPSNRYFLNTFTSKGRKTVKKIMTSRPNINDFTIFFRLDEGSGVDVNGGLGATADVIVRSIYLSPGGGGAGVSARSSATTGTTGVGGY